MEKILLQKPFLIESQFDRISNIFDNAGQVVLGIAVLSPIISGFKTINLPVVFSGVIVISLCWATSVWFTRKGEQK